MSQTHLPSLQPMGQLDHSWGISQLASPGPIPKPQSVTRRTLFLILGAGALLRVASFFVSDNASGDALARAALTAQWLQHPGLKFHFDVWLPMHFWLIGAMSLIVGKVELAARLLSLILGIGSLALFWRLSEELDGAESAVYSSILFAFYSLHIAYSATSSCDGSYLFFLLGGLAFFFRWRRLGGLFLLSIAALSLTASSGIRYEAWIVIFALDLILLYRRQWKAFGVFAFISGLWPVFWMIYESFTRGNPLYAPVLNHFLVAMDLHFAGSSLTYRLLLPPGVILITLTPLVLIGVLFSMRYILKKKGLLGEFTFIVCFFSLVQLYQVLSGGVMSFARYTLTLGTMVAILAGIGLRQILPYKKLIAALMILNLAMLLVLSSVANPFIGKIRSVSPVLRFVPYLHDTGEFLKQHLQKDDAVVIDNYNYEANQLANLAGMPLLEEERAFKVPDDTDHQIQASKLADLVPYLHTRHPKYMVYADRGTLSTQFALPSDCSSAAVEGMQFHCVFRDYPYQIYEIQY